MYNIWLYFDVLCSAKSFSWNIDVKPSAPKYPMRRTIPYMESSCFARAELIDPTCRRAYTHPSRQMR